jgi:hypothetical protein
VGRRWAGGGGGTARSRGREKREKNGLARSKKARRSGARKYVQHSAQVSARRRRLESEREREREGARVEGRTHNPVERASERERERESVRVGECGRGG